MARTTGGVTRAKLRVRLLNLKDRIEDIYVFDRGSQDVDAIRDFLLALMNHPKAPLVGAMTDLLIEIQEQSQQS